MLALLMARGRVALLFWLAYLTRTTQAELRAVVFEREPLLSRRHIVRTARRDIVVFSLLVIVVRSLLVTL